MQRGPLHWMTIAVFAGMLVSLPWCAESIAAKVLPARMGSFARPSDASSSVAAGVQQPDEGDGENDAPAAGVIKGAVTKNGREIKRSRVVVEIEGLGEKFKKRVDANGKFEFTDVPGGKNYKLIVSGTYKGRIVEGTLEDVVPEPAAKAKPITIPLD